MKLITTFIAVVMLLATCHAGQEVLEYAKVKKVGTLSGVVTDQTGAPIPGTQVSEMSDDWKTELRSTSTDAQGRWSLLPRSGIKSYRIRFAKDGFNQVWVRLRIKARNTTPLAITLPVAT